MRNRDFPLSSVSKIAGLAAREIGGVHALGGGTARAFGAVGERIPGASSNVVTALERMTGLEVVEVDVSVNDVHIPSMDDDEAPEQPARVA